MSISINNLTISGNLTRDIEIRQTQSGTSVASFSIACNRKYNDKEEVSYFNVTVWGKLAEICGKFIGKGSSVIIVGRIKQDRWEQDGVNKQSVKIEASEVQFVGSKKENNNPVDAQTGERVSFE